MTRQDRLQTFVSLPVGNWVRQCAADQGESVSVFIRDLIVAAWHRDNEAKDRPRALDPARQNVFISVALDALLAGHPDPALRDRTHEAYRRRLERLGLPSSTNMGGTSHEA
jgi:Arc/MetJ-type ribon-helix-helix transcriptional regulator